MQSTSDVFCLKIDGENGVVETGRKGIRMIVQYGNLLEEAAKRGGDSEGF